MRDWRLGQLRQIPECRRYISESRLTAADILDYGIPHVALATGAAWRADGVGREHRTPLPFLAGKPVLTPDDLMAGGVGAIASPGPVVIFDDDRFYLASVLAELAAGAGHETVFVTPAPIVAPWSENTLEQERIQKRLIGLGVDIVPLHGLAGLAEDRLRVACVYSGRTQEIECGTLVAVTSRLPNDWLWRDLAARRDEWEGAGVRSVTRIGDCLAPGLIRACYREFAAADAIPIAKATNSPGPPVGAKAAPHPTSPAPIPESRSLRGTPASPGGTGWALRSGAGGRFPGRSRSPHAPGPPSPLREDRCR